MADRPDTRITVVVDNIPDGELKGEWGLSLFIEYGNVKLMADVGASDLFYENMRKLGLPIEEVSYAYLSHAHYDHANGMERFFKENSRADFYLREGSRDNCYKRIFLFHKYIGLPRRIAEKYPDRVRFVSGDYTLCEGVTLIPHKIPGLELLGLREKMYQKTENGWIPDDFSHEQSLVLETRKGLLIINSCSHGGVVNIINEVRQTFPDKPVYGVIGGFHLYNKTEAEVREVALDLVNSGVAFVCTGHCTGDKAYRILEEELGERLCKLHTGLVMEF